MYQPLDARETWTSFAKDFGAEHFAKGFGNQFDFYDQVVYYHKGLKIVMEYRKKENNGGTYIYAPFSASKGFDFFIYPDNFIEEIGKFFGMQDIETGDSKLDDKVIIKSSNEKNVKLFLANAKLRELISTLFSNGILSGYFYAGGKPENVIGKAEYIYFRYPGLIDDSGKLKQVFQLIIESLDQLIEMGITISPDSY